MFLFSGRSGKVIAKKFYFLAQTHLIFVKQQKLVRAGIYWRNLRAIGYDVTFGENINTKVTVMKILNKTLEFSIRLSTDKHKQIFEYLFTDLKWGT